MPILTGFTAARPRFEDSQDELLTWLADTHARAEASRSGLDDRRRDELAAELERLLRHVGCGPDQLARRGHSLVALDPTAPPFGGAARRGQAPAVDPTAPPFGGAARRGQAPAVDPTAPPFGGAARRGQAPAVDPTAPPFGGAARRGQAPAVDDRSDADAVLTAGMSARMKQFGELVGDYFTVAYPAEAAAPDDLIHVTCTGYVSPSPAQELAARRGWATRVTHAYHMGCYAAAPALRIAAGLLAIGSRRVDVVHTELCSLHFDPLAHAPEQLVVQSLFGDGFIRYAVVEDGDRPGLIVRAVDEAIVPDSADAMRWAIGDRGFAMTLARNVPDRIAAVLRDFVARLYARAGLELDALRTSTFAVHPGGPRIIDRVRSVLELTEAQVRASRIVLRDHGNMSSATLPYIWMRVLADEATPSGTLITSLAFGPGLTVCGAVLEKR